MIFECYVLVDDVDDVEATHPSSITVLVDTMADVLPYVRKDYISIISFLPSSSRRVLKSMRSAQPSASQGYLARYSTRVVLEELGYTSDQAAAAYDMMKVDIDEAIQNGQFHLFFDKHSNESGILMDALVPSTQSVTFSDYLIGDIALIGEEANIFIERGQTAFIVIVVVAAAGFVVMFLYYYRQRDVSFKLYVKRSQKGRVPSQTVPMVKLSSSKVSESSEFSEDANIVKNPLADDL
jgi:hypothetical protein